MGLTVLVIAGCGTAGTGPETAGPPTPTVSAPADPATDAQVTEEVPGTVDADQAAT